MSGIDFNIHFVTQTGERVKHTFSVSAINGASPKLLTLRASFPENASHYFLRLELDGHVYETPEAGFENLQELWEWVQVNLVNLGKWYLLNNELLLVVKAATGSLSVGVIESIRAIFPVLQPGEFYKVRLNGDTSPDNMLYSREDVLMYARNTWGDKGAWLTWKDSLILIQTINSTNTLKLWAAVSGAFSSGFSEDFA
ncbi:MAG: hypothetical protein JSS64_08440 [Bacteroidetes bacterium]|nr:hypothetical protein [Bacteroidota bacterium]